MHAEIVPADDGVIGRSLAGLQGEQNDGAGQGGPANKMKVTRVHRQWQFSQNSHPSA